MPRVAWQQQAKHGNGRGNDRNGAFGRAPDDKRDSIDDVSLADAEDAGNLEE
jgi:hypothetical protein